MESFEDFYLETGAGLPDSFSKQLGHFNVFSLDRHIGKGAVPAPYRRREFFNITIVYGKGKFLFADKTYEVSKHALVFSNPQVPYSWEQRELITCGYYCIFDQAFFHNHGNIIQYPLFRPDGNPIFELNSDQANEMMTYFERLMNEIDTVYMFKYDLIRAIVYEIVHFAMKLQQQVPISQKKHPNASYRAYTLFVELLDRQFPIENTHQTLKLRHASDYAKKLNFHVNHLNKAIKEVTEKTTSQMIAERLLREAKILLKQTSWNAGEIAFSLGFTETTNFNNFFKKHTGTSPIQFRNDLF